MYIKNFIKRLFGEQPSRLVHLLAILGSFVSITLSSQSHFIVKTLMTVVAISVLLENFSSRRLKKYFKLSLYQKSKYLTDSIGSKKQLRVINYYAIDSEKYFFPALVILSLSFLYCVLSVDYLSAAASMLVILTVSAYRFLTFWRVARGFFGNNADEALEIISFLNRAASQGGLPPGSTLSDKVARREEAQTTIPSSLGTAI
jgi:hypothetical protein